MYEVYIIFQSTVTYKKGKKIKGKKVFTDPVLHYTNDQAKLHVNNVTIAQYERRPLFLLSLPQGKSLYACLIMGLVWWQQAQILTTHSGIVCSTIFICFVNLETS